MHVAIPKRGRDVDTDNEDEDFYRNKISKANIALILAFAAIVDLDKKEENEDDNDDDLLYACASLS